jgi:hypothetical protein
LIDRAASVILVGESSAQATSTTRRATESCF